MTEAQASTRERVVTWTDPSVALPELLSMDGLSYLRAMTEGRVPIPPMAALMGFTGFTVEEGRVVFTIEPAEYHYNPLGSVHGGMVATLVDTALGCAVQSTLPAGTGYTTIDLSVTFLRPITVDTGTVTCVAEAVHTGRRIATATARVEDAAGKLLATATATQLILAPEAPPA